VHTSRRNDRRRVARLLALLAPSLLTAALMVAMLVALFVSTASAHRLTYGEIQRSGSHWCNWSVASTCSRWRANGGRSYGLGCTGPNDMRSGCRARGLR
jgi:hypothetical protein